ncbi:MAG: 50S ribosomal protein L11 methyltransferase [Alphaproteobacteria bacterium]|nr:50S ribosomal protein L11 methyltransferase [Alphaproteobacteria bacterium]
MTELDRILETWPMLQGKGPGVWASFARVLLDKGKSAEGLALALAAYDHPDCGNRDRLIAGAVLNEGVPKWHWRLVRDTARNAAYEAALARVVGPDTLVLDIGAGTGLLGLMALRAGAGRVVACEMNPAVARMAAAIAAANGVSDRLRIVAKKSNDLVLGEDLDRRADVIVSEIVDNGLLGEGVLATHRDAVPRLLRPGGHVIPGDGAIIVALGHDPTLARTRMDVHQGFDLSAFNKLAPSSHILPPETPGLRLLSDPAALFSFAFGVPESWPGYRAEVPLAIREDGEANAVIQWIRLGLDRSGSDDAVHEVRPGRGSSWGLVSWPLVSPLSVAAGRRVRIAGERTDSTLMVWLAE